MNVLKRFVRKSLSKNRSRTLVTLVGIILSIALVTAVIEGAFSGVVFMRRSEEERVGKFHGMFYALSDGDVRKLEEDPRIDGKVLWQEVGWAKIEVEDDYKPYLLVESVGDDFSDLVSVQITSGAMPENEGEILLPAHLLQNGGAAYKIGDTLPLSLGRRVLEGRTLDLRCGYDPSETLEITEEKTYTVCGFYRRFSREVESYSCPGYTALTKGGGEGDFCAFFTLKQPRGYYEYIEQSPFGQKSVPHADLLNFYGTLRNATLSRVLYSFAAILIFLIAFGSISLIYNSFSISVSERTKQFGILKSTGATKKQIRACVFYEAFLLSAIAIPIGLIVGCIGIGSVLFFLRDSFAGFLAPDSEIQMKLTVSPLGLLISAALGLLTTLVSAYVPARRAMRISPIDSIRQTNDLKVSPRSLKTSKLTFRLFGFEGMIASKNFKRNRKRYRAVIVSLFLSISLFISASSFCSYLSDIVGGVTANEERADLIYSGSGGESSPEETFRLLSGAKGILKGEYGAVFGRTLRIRESDATEKMRAYFGAEQSAAVTTEAYLCFLSDEAFGALLRENGISEADYFDPGRPRAVFTNEFTIGFTNESGSMTWENFEIVRKNAFPLTIDLCGEPKEIEGYTFLMTGRDSSGGRCAVYLADEDFETYYEGETSEEINLDLLNTLRIPYDEAMNWQETQLGAAVETKILMIPSAYPAVVYPFSAAETVLGEKIALPSIEYAFEVTNHGETYNEMKKLLEEANLQSENLYDLNSTKEAQRMLVRVVRVFSYGFIILISLIAASNVFNTISTSVSLRRREFAMLRSIGMHDRGFGKMMIFECIIYGLKALLWGLPAAFLMTYLIYRAVGIAYQESFYLPAASVLIAIASVFFVVFASMLYAVLKIRKENPIDALKNENL